MHNARMNTPAPSSSNTPDTQAPALLLVDASSYLFRAYYALPDLRADPADPTSGTIAAYNKDLFRTRYKELFSQAVVIQ